MPCSNFATWLLDERGKLTQAEGAQEKATGQPKRRGAPSEQVARGNLGYGGPWDTETRRQRQEAGTNVCTVIR